MIDKPTLDQILSDLRQAIPGDLGQGLEKNLRAALTATFTRLNLVTREELEIQSAVLARTRARLEELERQVAELENNARKS